MLLPLKNIVGMATEDLLLLQETKPLHPQLCELMIKKELNNIRESLLYALSLSLI